MISKEDVIRRFLDNKDDHHKVFALAWGRFLTMDELRECDYLDVYDLDRGKYRIHSPKEWDENVIPYTKKNLIGLLGVILSKALDTATSGGKDRLYIYVEDCRAILDIIGNRALASQRGGDLEYLLMVNDAYGFQRSKNIESVWM